jgi:hypothetical protein
MDSSEAGEIFRAFLRGKVRECLVTDSERMRLASEKGAEAYFILLANLIRKAVIELLSLSDGRAIFRPIRSAISLSA